MTDITVKCVTVGDSSVGKSRLLHAYTTDRYEEVVLRGHNRQFEYEANITVEERNIKLRLIDTNGSSEYLYYDRLRPLTYLQSDVFLICFSVVDRETMANVKTKWCMELHQHAPGVPYLLCGTKTDLRSDPNTIELLKSKKTEAITSEEGVRMAELVSASGYVECSSLRMEGLQEVFLQTAKLAIPQPKKKKSSCVVL